MEFPVKKKAPRRKQDRIILHFDYDCFYAQVVENAQPVLKSLPLGIKQKSILATCNYVARRRGVRKLQLISEAKKTCPELMLVDGEDLSAFRDVSKKLYGLLRSYSWNSKVERLGLDEVFLDVTDIVDYNAALLNPNVLSDSFFCLSRDDPEKGFAFDATSIAGCVTGNGHGEDNHGNPLYVRLLLASHLARYLRLKIEEQGYTLACGISTSKVLSKLVGSVNKPRNQTTLLSLHEDEIISFMGSHSLRKVPGIGGKMTHALESYFLGRDTSTDTDTYTHGSSVTVNEFRTHPEVSPQMLEKLLGNRPGSEKGIGDKIWALLHGVDDTEVKVASSIPTQISIEDTYPGAMGGLNTPAEIEHELLKLAASLLRRMQVDLTQDEGAVDSAQSPANGSKRKEWLARPKTLRLATRPKTSPSDDKPYNWGRATRSQPLPTFIFHNIDDATIVRRLVTEALLPMFHKLNPHKSQGWNIGMINICVANMVLTATEDAAGSGRDISQMFRRQDDVLREFTVYDRSDETPPQPTTRTYQQGDENSDSDDIDFASLHYHTEVDLDDASDTETEPWDGQDGSHACGRCGHILPSFAVTAHERYHDLEDQ
ncbi:DNA polymerase iota [Cytospora mali]|uniref:DNA polymerase iota n=1 Tax=Cytospora mali TaxID=578113 RepID=A0A194V209_CYTMA|nr:DNA polymerase iota [Valsa mali var. pyri (nom. inval.)]